MSPREIEIKLRLDPDKAQRLFASRLLAGAQTSQEHFHTAYFDDEKQHLLKEGFELRIRRNGERSLQTLKTLDWSSVASGKARP